MEEELQPSTPQDVPESPKPLAFTIDFGGGKKSFDTQRHKALVEKFHNRHKRVQSLSKLEETVVTNKTEGSLNECKNVRTASNSLKLRSELSLPLKTFTTVDQMTQSFPNGSFNLDTIKSPEEELKNVSSPELETTPSPVVHIKKLIRHLSSPEVETRNDCNDFDFDKSDTASDAGTYTLETDNYTEEQKARMSIDRDFNIEQVSFMKKTEEYIQSLSSKRHSSLSSNCVSSVKPAPKQIPAFQPPLKESAVSIPSPRETVASSPLKQTPVPIQSPKRTHAPPPPLKQTAPPPPLKKTPVPIPSPKQTHAPPPPLKQTVPIPPKQTQQTIVKQLCVASKQMPVPFKQTPPQSPREKSRILSPILSPTQNLSIVDVDSEVNKILYPSPKAKTGIGWDGYDHGCFTSVTSSGAFSRKSETNNRHTRQPSLTKSEVQIQTYVDIGCGHSNGFVQTEECERNVAKLTNLPPAIGGFSGKNSPTKIPSPVHTALSRPRSRNSVSSLNIDLSDSSLETESFLKPTQNYINSLQKRLSLDSDPDSDYDSKSNNLRLNNETHDLVKQKSLHVRHNSFDDKSLKISNKLEHFQSKNLQGIDQTYTNKLNQYTHKLQNSPNNSPIRRSTSFSNKNHFINPPKVSNLASTTKDINLRNSPNLNQNGSIQRSSSTASIKQNLLQLRRSSINSEHSKIDRSQYGDTESSSEDDFERNLFKKKDFSNLTNTRYNRAFSLRRARLDSDQPKCPNTPEMRRKFQHEHIRSERAISVDRRPVKTNEVPSRYLQSSCTKSKPADLTKSVPKIGASVIKSIPGKLQVFSRTDSGRFSVRSSKPLQNAPKSAKKDGKKQSGGRSNSSLSSREVEFQNWKRRKSYDPMKAAAEGKKKAEMAKKQNHNIMTQSYNEHNQNQDCDSSPSHSSSVHRSQSFHGTAAIEQLLSSEDEELTLSADEGFSPPTPSPCELSPARNKVRHAWRDRLLH